MFYKTSHYPMYTTKTTPYFYIKKKKKTYKKRESHCIHKARVIRLVLFYCVDLYYFIVNFVR